MDGFIHQLVRHVRNGYVFYVRGEVPHGKDPGAVDEKLMSRYGIDVPPWTRARRPRSEGSVHYIRFGSTFVMLARPGKSRFFDDEARSIKDVRERPLRIGPYSLSYLYSTHTERWHASVRVERAQMLRVRHRLTRIAARAEVRVVEEELARLPFYPFAPVRRQLLAQLKHVNQVRRAAGRELVSVDVLRLRPWPVPVFAEALTQPCEGALLRGRTDA